MKMSATKRLDYVAVVDVKIMSVVSNVCVLLAQKQQVTDTNVVVSLNLLLKL